MINVWLAIKVIIKVSQEGICGRQLLFVPTKYVSKKK